ncbi:MAG: PIN domain-containing protein [Bryobacteraceae bacterium]
MSKVFLDTNFLVYLVDVRDPDKRAHTRILYRKLATERRAVVSTQVLQEFYVTIVNKIGVPPLEARHSMIGFERLDVVIIRPELIYEAIDTSILNRLSFWDGLIIAAAASARCDILLTEDMGHGTVIRGVKIVNPFEYEEI